MYSPGGTHSRFHSLLYGWASVYVFIFYFRDGTPATTELHCSLSSCTTYFCIVWVLYHLTFGRVAQALLCKHEALSSKPKMEEEGEETEKIDNHSTG
jgi:hypothetical protein